MKNLSLLCAMVVALFGCDDPTVHSLITSNFVCVYMPYWMGECDSTEMTARAQNVLDHGLVNAQIRCQGQSVRYRYYGYGDATQAFTYDAQKLQDGSCLVKYNGAMTLWERSEPQSQSCNTAPSGCYSASASGGQLHFISCDESVLENFVHQGPTESEQDIESVCTGFNLSAFGVSE